VNGGLVWTPQAIDDLRRLDRTTAERIVQAVERLAQTAHGDVRRLQGREREWRLRVGDWRVIFTRQPKDHSLRILRVRPRGSAYRD
jgi:mRNA interferase RelE/StbE